MRIFFVLRLVLDMLYVPYTFIVSIVCRRRRRQKIGEIRHLIGLIQYREGCSTANQLRSRIIHMLEHYRIDLQETGYTGTLRDLSDNVKSSLERAENTRRRHARIYAKTVAEILSTSH